MVGKRRSREAERFVWHPVVHQLYRQRLTFFIVRTSHIGIEAAMTAVAESLPGPENLQSWNIYAVYGEDDLVIRCWAGAERLHRIRENLKAPPREWIVDQFDCEDVIYLWQQDPTPAVTEDLVAQHADEIRAMNREGHTQLLHHDGEKVLADLGILIPVPHREPGSVKLYLLLSSRQSQNGNLRDRLTAALQRSENLSQVTLHCSTDGRYLVKAISRSYDLVLPSIKFIDESLDQGHLDKKTLLVAAMHRDENDNIDESAEHLSTDLSILVRICGIELEALLPSARDDARLDLERWYRENVPLFARAKKMAHSSPPFALPLNALLGMAIYRITGNGSRFNELTSPLFNALETATKTAILNVSIDVCGATWYHDLEVDQALDECEVEGRDGAKPAINNATMGQIPKLLSALAQRSPEFGGKVESVFGSGWKRFFGQIHDVRNDFQHGRVADNNPESVIRLAFTDWEPPMTRTVDAFIRASGYKLAREGS
jgi:hypothetical protein